MPEVCKNKGCACVGQLENCLQDCKELWMKCIRVCVCVSEVCVCVLVYQIENGSVATSVKLALE